MASELHLVVSAADAGERLDSYLGARSACPSRSACARLVEAGSVAVNGETCLSKKQAVAEGDRICVELPEVREPGAIVPQAIPLDIRYEDDYLIVLSKQRGLVCHPAHGHEERHAPPTRSPPPLRHRAISGTVAGGGPSGDRASAGPRYVGPHARRKGR